MKLESIKSKLDRRFDRSLEEGVSKLVGGNFDFVIYDDISDFIFEVIPTINFLVRDAIGGS